MFEAIKTVIASGRYELADLLGKVDKLWVQGSLTDAQREELMEMARAQHDPAAGYAPLEQQVRELRSRVEALEEAQAGGAEDNPAAEEYPAWKQPTGAHDAYYTGAKMTYTDGKQYQCIAPAGFAVTYGPDVLPGMWQLI